MRGSLPPPMTMSLLGKNESITRLAHLLFCFGDRYRKMRRFWQEEEGEEEKKEENGEEENQRTVKCTSSSASKIAWQLAPT